MAAQSAALGLAAPQSASFAERWYVLIMMCLVYTLSIADRYVVSTVLDPIRRELHLTDSGVAFLTAWPLAIFYVTLGFPLSYLIDRRSRRKIIGVCLVLWSCMTTLCGLAQTIAQFFFARVGVGVGEAGGTPGASSLLSDYFPATPPRHGAHGVLPRRPDRRLARLQRGRHDRRPLWLARGVLCARAPRGAGRRGGVVHGARTAARLSRQRR